MNKTGLLNSFSIPAFLAHLERSIADQSCVRLQPKAFKHAAECARDCAAPNWSWFLPTTSSVEVDFHTAVLEFAFNAANNGGYWFMGATRPFKWGLAGSGSDGLRSIIHLLRHAELMPWSGRDVTWEQVRPYMRDIPYLDKRRAVFFEFQQPANRFALIRLAERGAERGGFDLSDLQYLASLLPASFADGDPFLKKANLFFMMLSGWLNHVRPRTEPVRYDLICACDYQLPRALAYLGCLSFSDEAIDKIIAPGLLQQNEDLVFAVRAATAICVQEIASMAAVNASLVDAALFLGIRRDPEFERCSPPCMAVETFWF